MTAPESRTEDPEFVSRLAAALEMIERGDEPDTRLLCEGRPELRPELEAALAGIDRLPALHEAAATFDPNVGSVLAGRYELVSRIGSGGMGVVYEAVDKDLGRVVAVKMLRTELVSGEELEARFGREAEVLASIEHPGIVTLFDRGRSEDGHAFLVMARLRGRTGNELLGAAPEQTPVGTRAVETTWLAAELGGEAGLDRNYLRQVVAWTAKLARALHAIHRAGVVHRDVKPSNFFVQQDGTPVLIDFGLVTFGQDATVAIRDAAIGTPAYMAPEQLDAKNAATPRTDVYGLTATLYHFLTFQRPYQGTPSQVLAALQRREPTPAHRLRPGLPRDMQAILDRGMAREPERRYATARELAEDLEAWLDYRPVKARPVSTAARWWRRARRTATFRVSAVVLGLLVVAWTVGLWIQAQERARSAEFAGHWARVPGTIVMGLPEVRVAADAEAEAEIEKVLDGLVAAAAEPSPARVIRAGFYRDRGRHDAARQDMRAVADHYGTVVARAVAAQYDESESAIDVGSLEPTAAPVDRFLVAFHEMRPKDRNPERAVKLLEGGTDHGLPELRLLAEYAVMAKLKTAAEQRAACRRIHIEAERLEVRRGGPMALTAKAIGESLMGLSQNADAERAFAPAVQRAPYDYTLWHNLARVQHALGDPQARASALRALALQPKSVAVHELLFDLDLLAADFVAAETWIAKTPYVGEARAKRGRAWLRGRLLLRQALAQLESKPGAARSAAQQEAASELAMAAYQQLADARPEGETSTTYEMLVALCVARPNGGYTRLLVGVLRNNPLDWNRLNTLFLLLPSDFDPQLSRAVADLVLGFSQALAPDRFSSNQDRHP